MKTITIKQGGMFPGTPHQVYEIFLDNKKHEAVIGGKTRISREVGGTVTTFDGWASGKNIELVKDKKIVQSWRGDDWPAGHYSTITLHLLPAKGGKTKFLFRQTDVPATVAKNIAAGWRQYYWEPIRRALSGNSNNE